MFLRRFYALKLINYFFCELFFCKPPILSFAKHRTFALSWLNPFLRALSINHFQLPMPQNRKANHRACDPLLGGPLCMPYGRCCFLVLKSPLRAVVRAEVRAAELLSTCHVAWCAVRFKSRPFSAYVSRTGLVRKMLPDAPLIKQDLFFLVFSLFLIILVLVVFIHHL